MPIHEYLCKECGHKFEVIQKFNDPPIDICIKCGGKTDKLISNSTFTLKGSGWYLTDYARKGKEYTTEESKKESTDNYARKGKEYTTKEESKKESTEKPKE